MTEMKEQDFLTAEQQGLTDALPRRAASKLSRIAHAVETFENPTASADEAARARRSAKTAIETMDPYSRDLTRLAMKKGAIPSTRTARNTPPSRLIDELSEKSQKKHAR